MFDKKRSDEISQLLLEMSFEKGGRGKDNKVDCYGILMCYYEKFDLKLPDYSSEDNWENRGEVYLREYGNIARKLKPEEKPEIGDCILFNDIEGEGSHAGVYLGESKFIHVYRKIGVKIDSLINNDHFFGKKVFGFFRVKQE